MRDLFNFHSDWSLQRGFPGDRDWLKVIISYHFEEDNLSFFHDHQRCLQEISCSAFVHELSFAYVA